MEEAFPPLSKSGNVAFPDFPNTRGERTLTDDVAIPTKGWTQHWILHSDRYGPVWILQR